jgi:glucose/arabinose dehydrogenase
MRHVILAALLALPALPAAAAGGPRLPLPALVPAGFSDAIFCTGLTLPVAMEFAPDGRLFVCEKNGNLRIITAAGSLLAAPFMTLAVDTMGERGLLGITFDPQFASNGYLYCYYTATTPTIHNRVSRFTANGDVVVPGSEVPLLDLDDIGAAWHNAGSLHFGVDGKLYIATGEKGVQNNAQLLTNRLGKILRVNSDGSIPSDNPASFPGIAGTTTGLNRAIYAVGLRNPFTFAIQPGTGRIFVNDVGEMTWEEVNEIVSGANYGWPATEGDFSAATFPNFRRPLHTYTHDGGAQGDSAGEAICGATFYPVGGPFPAFYHGKYFFGDLTNGWLRTLDPADNSTTLFATALNSTVSLRVGPDGALYYLSHNQNRVGRITYVPAPTPPSITLHPSNQTVPVGQAATFTVSASGTAPLAYQWQRNTVDVGGATSSSYTLSSPQLADNGAQFRCVVTNGVGSATSNAATLTVTSNQAPVATIPNPPAGTTYTAGDVIVYAGTGSDPEDGTLPAGSFTWRVDFHHNSHVHPHIAPSSGATGGSFTIPTAGEVASDVWYRIYLTVQDSGGLSTTVFRDVVPITAAVTLVTNPPGLQITLDSQPQTAPHLFTGVAGMVRSLEAASPQVVSGTTYTFVSWSDGGAATHTIATPATATTYTATFQPYSMGTGTTGGGSSGGGSCGLLGLEAIIVLGLWRRRRVE